MKTRLLIIISVIIVFFLISFAMPNLSKVYDSCEMTQSGTLQFAIGYQWTNGLFYIDNAECTWKLFGVIPIVNIVSENENQFGGPGNRHPSFLGFYVSPSCTDEMIQFLQKHSNMFTHEEYFYINDIGLPEGMDEYDYQVCHAESLANRGLDTRVDDFVPEPITKPEPEPIPEPEPSYTLTEVHCFANQIIYNDECIYVLTPTDEFPEDMTKYFLIVDDKITNFCEIEYVTTDRENISANTLDRCFEISHYSISDVNEIEFQSTTPPTWINIKLEDLTRNVELGSSPTFTVIESGWGNGCTSPTLEVYRMTQEIGNDYTSDDLVYKHRIVYSCPYYEPTYPPRDVLRIWDESDFTNFPICEEQGRYLIVGDSGYERLALDYYYCGIENEQQILEYFQNVPEVIAFYATYNDAQASVRDDHMSYFAGSKGDFHVRMNLFFDETYDLDHIDFHCYYQNEHQFELAQEDIVSSLEKYYCK